MASEDDLMSTPKNPPQARINPAIAGTAVAAAKEELMSFNQFVNQAVKEKLERMGKWPPKSKKKTDPA